MLREKLCGSKVGLTECKLFESTSRGFGEEEPDKDNLEQEEDAVADVVFPA